MNEKAIQIITQVNSLYHRYGIKSVTMDDVARYLGISKKTLYEHFRDKEDLVEAVLMNEHERVCGFFNSLQHEHLNAIEEMFGIYRMINMMYRDYNPSMVYDIRKYYPGLFQKIRDIKRQQIYQSAFENLKKGKSEGLYRSDLDPGILARLHVLRTEALFNNDLFTQEELTSFALFHEVFIYHIHGILSHEGRKFFEENFGKFTSTL